MTAWPSTFSRSTKNRGNHLASQQGHHKTQKESPATFVLTHAELPKAALVIAASGELLGIR